MASVLLHFGAKEPYPILDFRALWSLGLKAPSEYTFELWWGYTEYCRAVCDREGIQLRDLDRALWQYSKDFQDKAV